MIRILFSVLCLSFAAPDAAAQGPAALIDAEMTPGAGAALVDFVGTALARVEHTVLPPRLFEEDTRLRRSLGVSYRFAKLFALDLPQEEWLRVANHEVFGHGARLRERFDGPIGYTIGVPPPYGGGGGSTSFSFDREPTLEEVLLITVGGMEANNVGASRIALRAITRGESSYRDLLRYLLLRLDTPGYISSTGDDPEREGHDVSDFLVTLREAGGSTVTARDLRRRALIGLADPLIGYAVYGLAVAYLWRGDDDAPVPTFRLGSLRYLPALRFQLAPFGTEWVMDNTFAGGAGATRVSLRIGEAPGAQAFGASLHRENVWSWRRARIDADIHAWSQPRLLDTGLRGRSAGGAALVTVASPLDVRWLRWAELVVQGGYKTRGFLEGERLNSGLMLRAGVAVIR